MDKNKQCEILFNRIKQIGNKYAQIGETIKMLNVYVQNPDFIKQEDWIMFDNECRIVADIVKREHEDSVKQLNEIYSEIMEIYNGCE